MDNYKEILEKSGIFRIAYENNNLLMATIELCTVCNWKCRHCYLPEHNHKGLTTEEVFLILDELRELGCFYITFTGGDIFCRNDAMDIIRKSRELGFNVALYTNISLVGEEIIKELASLYINEISCTLFSLDEKIHDNITGIEGSFKKVLENIMLIKKYGIDLEIKNILMRDNYKSYVGIKKFCDIHDFKIRVTPVIWPKHDGDKSYEKWRLTKEELEEVLPDVDEIDKISRCVVTEESKFCNEINFSLAIDSKGDAYPCIEMRKKLGNILNRNIKNVWENSKELKELRKLNWSCIPECLECENKEYCRRCAGVALLETNDIFGYSKIHCLIGELRRKYHEELEIQN